MEIKGEKYLQGPRPIKAPPIACNRSKYCWFYCDHGHDTKKYIQLKDKIEALICQGYLGKYVHGKEVQSHVEVLD